MHVDPEPEELEEPRKPEERPAHPDGQTDVPEGARSGPSSSRRPPELTVVVPAFNEEPNLRPLWQRVGAALESQVDGLELVIVDDGSSDGTWREIQALAGEDERVHGIRFARNFGHQAAVTAGLDAARGRAVVIIDADLQDPPEVIPELVQQWRDGFEVVYAQREAHEGETWFKRASAALYYRLLRSITNVDIPVDTGDFRLLGPRAVQAMRALPERNPFIRGLVSWIGFPATAVRYRRHARRAGETKYPLRKMIRFALDGVTSFSFLPLRLATYAGFVVSGGAFFYILVVLMLKVLGINWAGYTSLMASILFLGGVQLIMIGILGEYLARIFDEVKQRPLYLVAEGTSDEDRVVPPHR